MTFINIIKILIVSIALLYSCFTDIKERKIKNFVTFPLMLFGIIINVIEFGFMNGIIYSFKGLFFIFISCLIVSIVGGLGFGDTKLLMGIGATYGFWFSFDTLLFALITMIIYFIVFKFKLIKDLFRNLKYIFLSVLYRKELPKLEKSAWTVPYALFITLGFFITFIYNLSKGETFIWNILN